MFGMGLGGRELLGSEPSTPQTDAHVETQQGLKAGASVGRGVAADSGLSS